MAAITLYAQQAAYGSSSGAASLLFVARAVAGNEARLKAVLRDPVGQRLLATYAWTRGHEELWNSDLETSRPAPLKRLLEALAAQPRLAGADRLAATAWTEGRFDLAERFADVESTPLATWVKAKLAMRRGDPAAADRLLEEAARGFPAAENWETTDYEYARRPHATVEGERALLALMRGDFTQAAERVLQTCSWPDIAYVAERVLTVEELQRLLADPSSAPALACKPEFLWYGEEDRPTVQQNLRWLLGRRLLRDGQGARALEYFQGTKREQGARQYVDALERARSASAGVNQAEALHAAAKLARGAGLELLGTEVAPDWAWAGAEFEVDDFYSYSEEEESPPESRKWASRLVLTPESERARLKAHAPPHVRRFHYRSTAADLAEKAAAQVPPRSQAYAALLCQAARYSSRSDPERVQHFWDTYIQKGALLREPMIFGVECPEPDFQRVRQQSAALSFKRPRLRTLAAVGGGLLLPVVGLVLLRRRRRHQEPAAPTPPPGTP